MLEDKLISPIYKVNYLVNGEIDTIYVFYGKKYKEEVISEEELFSKIFSEEELEIIHEKDITIKFSNQQIYYDDTIASIKVKILIELKNISIEEIYLFCQKIEKLDSNIIYQSLTQNKRIELTNIRLEQLTSNIISNEMNEKFINPLKKENYNFEDILNMKIENQKYIINKVLGQPKFIIENEYPFICNPYNITEKYDLFLKKKYTKINI